MPLIKVVDDTILGFCCTLLKPLGPLQLYNEPTKLVAVKFIVLPAHTVAPVVAIVGVGLMVIDEVTEAVQPPTPVTVKV